MASELDEKVVGSSNNWQSTKVDGNALLEVLVPKAVFQTLLACLAAVFPKTITSDNDISSSRL